MENLKKGKNKGKGSTKLRSVKRMSFFLVRFQSGELYVAESNKMHFESESDCTVKVKGGRYAATVISISDKKEYLLERKNSYKFIEKSPTASPENPKQINIRSILILSTSTSIRQNSSPATASSISLVNCSKNFEKINHTYTNLQSKLEPLFKKSHCTSTATYDVSSKNIKNKK